MKFRVLILGIALSGCYAKEAAHEYLAPDRIDRLETALVKLSVSAPMAVTTHDPKAIVDSAVSAYTVIKWLVGFGLTATTGYGLGHVNGHRRGRRQILRQLKPQAT